MAFIVLCTDGPDVADVRQSELQAHLDYMAQIAGTVLVAGPLNLAGDARFNGSVFVYAVDTQDEARELLEHDPYFRAGLYTSVEYAAFTPARGEWLQSPIST